jgi:hypothetical protein
MFTIKKCIMVKFSDVQDFGSERADLGLLAVRALLGGRQVLRWAGNAAGTSPGGLLPLHFKIQGLCGSANQT